MKTTKFLASAFLATSLLMSTVSAMHDEVYGKDQKELRILASAALHEVDRLKLLVPGDTPHVTEAKATIGTGNANAYFVYVRGQAKANVLATMNDYFPGANVLDAAVGVGGAPLPPSVKGAVAGGPGAATGTKPAVPVLARTGLNLVENQPGDATKVALLAAINAIIDATDIAQCQDFVDGGAAVLPAVPGTDADAKKLVSVTKSLIEWKVAQYLVRLGREGGRAANAVMTVPTAANAGGAGNIAAAATVSEFAELISSAAVSTIN
jgi:hypothetical protein